MAPSCVALIILEEGGFIMGHQDKVKVSNGARDWESIGAWEFCPIIVPSMKSLLISHPTFNKYFLVFHHVVSLMPIKIHTIF